MTLITSFSEILKFSKKKKSEVFFFVKENKESDGIFDNVSFLEIKSSE